MINSKNQLTIKNLILNKKDTYLNSKIKIFNKYNYTKKLEDYKFVKSRFKNI